MQGLVRGWIEAKFCNKIRNGQFSPRSTRNPSFCTAPRREIFEMVREEVASVAEISKNFLKIFFENFLKIFEKFPKIFQAKLIVRDKLTARAWGRAP